MLYFGYTGHFITKLVQVYMLSVIFFKKLSLYIVLGPLSANLFLDSEISGTIFKKKGKILSLKFAFECGSKKLYYWHTPLVMFNLLTIIL